MTNKHIGSDFDEFLREEGILVEGECPHGMPLEDTDICDGCAYEREKGCAKLQERFDQLRAHLFKYGRHLDWCHQSPWPGDDARPCNCGFDEAFAT